ncbi:DUF3322 and DUF2220 domain-containing protein [Cellulomonas palmilytica]|uniref:DUF3322 and DUF2220 domain-containing protein n=1 Tax=Cellulomonas palmilytica TaxID=2608402 RepID=UPI001F1FF7A6|nr:DUF3322 and DUF2220 domain-containing protein [Cellulomonas palmilytica]UJP38873.1 hypothetical protein F1D97_10795 [Cellulomonas palmilytica]
MSRLLDVSEAVAAVARRWRASWADALVSEHLSHEPWVVEVALRPGERSGADHLRVPAERRRTWHDQWRELERTAPSGVGVIRAPVPLLGVLTPLPALLRVEGTQALDTFLGSHGGYDDFALDAARARRLLLDLTEHGGSANASALRSLVGLDDDDARVALDAVAWLAEHPDLSEHTPRSLPIPGAHAKWVDQHARRLLLLTGRDVLTETMHRPPVAHLTYVDPGYLATGGRRHDAWTAGDCHTLPYEPRLVLVVENRDCRLRLPPVDDAVVVEGGGRAAATLIAEIPWVRSAEKVVYWGDIDADGFAILDSLRAALREASPTAGPAHDVVSLLMDAVALERYRSRGVARDRRGRLLRPSSTPLRELTDAESAAYAQIATSGPADVRRIEQERIPVEDVVDALVACVARPDDETAVH